MFPGLSTRTPEEYKRHCTRPRSASRGGPGDPHCPQPHRLPAPGDPVSPRLINRLTAACHARERVLCPPGGHGQEAGEWKAARTISCAGLQPLRPSHRRGLRGPRDEVGAAYGPYQQSLPGDDLPAPMSRSWCRQGLAYPCFCTQEQLGRGAAAAGGGKAAHRLLRRLRRLPESGRRRRQPGGSPRRPALCGAAALPGQRGAADQVRRPHPRRHRDAGKRSRTSCCLKSGRHPHLPFCPRGGRPSDAHHPCHPRRRMDLLRPQPSAAVPGAGLQGRPNTPMSAPS